MAQANYAGYQPQPPPRPYFCGVGPPHPPPGAPPPCPAPRPLAMPQQAPPFLPGPPPQQPARYGVHPYHGQQMLRQNWRDAERPAQHGGPSRAKKSRKKTPASGQVAKRRKSGKSKHHNRKHQKRVHKQPESNKLQCGDALSLDPAWRQGLADVAAGTVINAHIGTNIDLLDAIEGNTPKAPRRDNSVESGDEASCPAADESDGESSKGDEDDVECGEVPAEMKELLENNKTQLARYTLHLEQQVLRLQADLSNAQDQVATMQAATAPAPEAGQPSKTTESSSKDASHQLQELQMS